MNLIERDGVQFFTSEMLASVVHGFSTRMGGVSKGRYRSLNLWHESGDSTENVLVNRERLAAGLRIDPPELSTLRQVHGDHIVVVDGPFEDRALEGDGLITDRPGMFLAVGAADCVPILLWDPERPAVGAIHAGWGGIKEEIARKAVIRMTELYGSWPDRIRAVIGPAAGPCCYEIKDDVARYFPEAFLKRFPRRKIHLDLAGANRHQLLEAGLNEDNIETSDLCTMCHSDLFFSYRRDKGKTGGMLAVIGLSTP